MTAIDAHLAVTRIWHVLSLATPRRPDKALILHKRPTGRRTEDDIAALDARKVRHEEASDLADESDHDDKRISFPLRDLAPAEEHQEVRGKLDVISNEGLGHALLK